MSQITKSNGVQNDHLTFCFFIITFPPSLKVFEKTETAKKKSTSFNNRYSLAAATATATRVLFPSISAMEEAAEDDLLGFGFGSSIPSHPPPPLVSLTPFSPSVYPSPRRLSSCFSQPSRPVSASRKLAWVSLQGRLVGAEEASSARAMGGGGLSRDEAVSWELFTPIHRILIVAVVAVAVAESKKNRQISQLRKSVELRVSTYGLFYYNYIY